MREWEKLLVRLEQNDPTIPDLDLSTDNKEKPKDKELVPGNKGIEDVGLEKLCAALKHNLTLESLNLNKNKITPLGAHSLASLLSNNTHIKVLHLHGNSIGPTGCVAICEAIKNNKGSKLEVLSFGGDNQIGAEGLAAVCSLLQSCQSLKEISLVSEISHEQLLALEDLVKAISKSKNLKTINFSYCSFGDKGAEIIATTLFAKKNKIKTLELVGCQIGDTGATHLLNCINDSRNYISLDKLSISFNPISGMIKTHITQALEERKKLKDLKKNPSSEPRKRSGTTQKEKEKDKDKKKEKEKSSKNKEKEKEKENSKEKDKVPARRNTESRKL